MRPRLKGFARRLTADGVSLTPDPGVEIVIPDPQGQVSYLLDLLDGSRQLEEIAREVRERSPEITDEEIRQAIQDLDQADLLEDGDAPTTLSPWQQERYFSNLAFFGSFANLSHSRYSYQDRLRLSRVLLLGAGGLGSTLLYNLAGLGVRHVTLVDHDRVELKNLARQYLYDEGMVGLPKVECAARRIASFNSEIQVTPMQEEIRSAADVGDLLANDRVDLVLSAVDQPAEVQDWVNEACVAARVPFVTGGFQRGRGLYYSIDPGRSGCRACLDEQRGEEDPQERFDVTERTNRGLSPVASFVASLIGLEAVRYLTGFAPPVAAGKIWLVDFASARMELAFEWSRLLDCRLCGGRSGEPGGRSGVLGGRSGELETRN